MIPSVFYWSTYIDMYGSGWLYDYIGHKEEELDSPFGMQWGMILVPKAFADEALALFPTEVTKLTDLEAQSFFEGRVKVKEPDYIINEEALKVFDIKDKYKITLTPEEEINKSKALDPNDETVEGLKYNKMKQWSHFKLKKGITIVQ